MTGEVQLQVPPAEDSLQSLFQEYERQIRVSNYRTCSILASVSMLFGASLDWVVYGWEGVTAFFPLRLLTTAVLVGVWLALGTDAGRRRHRLLGLLMAAPLMLSISWMIYRREGAASPYYAGLNLVMLGAAVLMRWPLIDSIIVVAMTILSYLVACYAHGPITNPSILYNNLYFLLITGVFTTAGTWLYNKIRLSEFLLRHRLDENRAELEVANERLGESLTQLEETNQKLREMDEVKSRFFANVSHELRTPLTLMIAPVETLINKVDHLDRAESLDLLGTMHGNAMRLLKLINDLLDLVRLESGKIQLKQRSVPVEAFISGLANAVQGVAKDKRIHLSTHCDADLGSVMADAEKLERICLNLLFNALKFTPSGGTVQFNALHENGWLCLQVKDSGVGIPPEQLPHIFNRFWQADTSSQRKYQGLGIGLALVKELAEAHGGGVTAESVVGKGTTITVRLPYQEVHEAEIVEPEEATEEEGAVSETQEWISDLYRRAERFPGLASLQAALKPVETSMVRKGARPKLLIADDEPDMLRFLSGQLGAHFDVLEAVDGHQAVEKAAQFLPDIILSDMMMPEKDGLQVCRELRQKSTTKLIPVVLLTARADEKTKLDCLAAGASDFLAKPFSLTELSVRLKNLVDGHLYQRELAQQKQRLEAALEQVKETESMLVRNEKLAALGRLSAGLIHEINNPLNYAKQGLYVLRETSTHLPEDQRPEYDETLKDIENGVDRVARIIADLRSFTRTTHEIDQFFQLKPAVETTLRFFSHEFKAGVKVTTDIPERTEFRGDRNQIVQVLINLIQNALDAMNSKEYPEGEERALHISSVETETDLQIRIRDNGPGIPDSVLQQIFDPFFTTKDVGAGMGLGLSITYQIISEHGGRILVNTEPGQYCEFVLEFPPATSILDN